MRAKRPAPVAKTTLPDPAEVRWIRAPIVEYFESHGRAYPWRQDSDPYRILMAVFMLQRTGVGQVMNVYERFVAAYPTVEALAGARLDRLRAIMRPLGRVGRLDHLRALGRAILETHQGRVPDRLEDLEALPGVGQYTARAVLCLAWNRPYIMLDPNSYRVLTRACGISARTSRPHADRGMISRLDRLVPRGDPRAFNLGLLDLASDVCRNRNPRHEDCPLARCCLFVAQESIS